MANIRQNVRVGLYVLKKEYGLPIQLKKLTTSTFSVDAKTGVQTASYTTLNIARAIVLPAEVNKIVATTLALLGVSSIKYGGNVDRERFAVIIDAVDLGTFVLETNDLAIYNGKTYNIKPIETMPTVVYCVFERIEKELV